MDNQRLEELKLQIRELEQQQDGITLRVDLAYFDISRLRGRIPKDKKDFNKETEQVLAKIDEIHDKIIKPLEGKQVIINEKKAELQKEIYLLSPPKGSNGVVDLRSINDNNNYKIFLHNQTQVIGNISWRGYHIPSILGDVGYIIEADYRGHGYAYEALCVLGEILNKKGISDFWITVQSQNASSIRTIERYGGVLKEKDEMNVLHYECQTLRKDEQIQRK